MQPLELTKEHIEQLLEMSAFFFKEEKIYFKTITHSDTFHNNVVIIVCFKKINKHTERILYAVGWYEFCITILYKKICKKTHILSSLAGAYNLINRHPVENLYSHFKNLKF